MTHSIERKDGDLIVTVTPERADLEKLSDKVIRELCAEVTVPGFRRGKAPLSMAAARVSEAARNERFNRELVNKAFRSYTFDPEVILALEADVPAGAVPAATYKADGTVTFTYPLLPQVETLGTYTGVKTEVKEEEVTDETVQRELERIASDESDLTPTDEAIENGFTANCDIRGSIAGVERPEVSEKGFDIKVGSTAAIPGISEALLGHRVGETVTTDVTLPENFPDEVANKEVHFIVKINSVKKVVTPAIDDELATLQTEFENVSNLDELKAKIREKQAESFRRNAENDKLSKVLTECNKTTKYAIDEARLKEAIVDNQRKQDEEYLKSMGLDLNAYLKMISMDLKTYGDNVYRNTLSQLQSTALQHAIAKAIELPEPTEEELKAVCERNQIDYEAVSKSLSESFRREFKAATDEQVNAYLKLRFSAVFDTVQNEKLRKFLLDNND